MKVNLATGIRRHCLFLYENIYYGVNPTQDTVRLNAFSSEPEGGLHPEHQADADPDQAGTHPHLRVRDTAHQQALTSQQYKNIPNYIYIKLLQNKHNFMSLLAG